MRLTDNERKMLEYQATFHGYVSSDLVGKLDESEEEAWQGVDRLREENERLKSQLDDAYKSFQEIGIMCSFEQTAQILRILGVTQQAIQRIKGEGTE